MNRWAIFTCPFHGRKNNPSVASQGSLLEFQASNSGHNHNRGTAFDKYFFRLLVKWRSLENEIQDHIVIDENAHLFILLQKVVRSFFPPLFVRRWSFTFDRCYPGQTLDNCQSLFYGSLCPIIRRINEVFLENAQEFSNDADLVALGYRLNSFITCC